MWFSGLIDKLRYSEFYLHHSGFGGLLLVTFIDKRHQDLSPTFALVEEATKKFRDINAGRNAVYLEFESDSESGDRFVCLGFDHYDLIRRNRVDLFLAPGRDTDHIYVRLTASRALDGTGSNTLFDGEVAMFDDANEEVFIMDAPGILPPSA